MKNLKRAMKRTICLLLTVAMLCADTGATVYAAEGAEQEALEGNVEATLAEDVQDEEVQEEGGVQIEDEQSKETSEGKEQTEGDLEEGGTGKDSLGETPVEGEAAGENSDEENTETDVAEENPVTGDETEEDNIDVEDEENIDDVSVEESVLENDMEEDAEGNLDTGEEKTFVLDIGEEYPTVTENINLETGGSRSCGTDSFFRIYFRNKAAGNSRIEPNVREFPDGWTSTHAINMQQRAEVSEYGVPGGVVGFTTTSEAKVKVYWSTSGSSSRTITILDENGDTVHKGEDVETTGENYLNTFDLAESGIYYLGGTNSVRIFKVEVTGRMEMNEDEGNDIAWEIDANGKLTVEGTGNFTSDHSINRTAPWYGDRESVKTAEVNVTGMTDASYMFYGCSNLTSLDLSGFDTSSVTNMAGMFSGCGNLTSLDASDLDTGSVTNMSGMFLNCISLSSLDVSSFSASNVTSMSSMFYGCSSLSSLDMSGLDTSSVTSMTGMFLGCRRLGSLDVSGLNTGSVTSMEYMFYGCSGLKSLDVSGLNTSNVTSMEYMFYGCSGLKSLDVSGLNTSNVTSMECMFSTCRGLTSLDVSGIDTSNVIEMSNMFYDCSSLTSLDMSGFNTSKVTGASDMFTGSEKLKTICTPYNLKVSVSLPDGLWYKTDGTQIMKLPINLNHSIFIKKGSVPVFSVLEVTKTKTVYLYGEAVNVDDLTVLYYDADGIPHKLVENDYTTNAAEIDMSTSGEKTLVVSYSDGASIFTDEITLSVMSENIIAYGEYKEDGNDIIWTIDKDGKLTIEGMGDFASVKHGGPYRVPWYDNRESVKTAEVNVKGMTDASYMFYDCSNLTSLDLSSFDTSSVISMSYMFAYCSNLTSLDVSGFDTSSVMGMSYMFDGCSNLTNLNVDNFDTSNVTSMNGMFYGCDRLTSLDLSKFNANQVTNVFYMSSMFPDSNELKVIRTPYNLKVSVSLPDGLWYQTDGSQITELPINLDHSILLKKGGEPVFSVLEAAKTKTVYLYGEAVKVDDLTVFYYDADGIANKLVENDYTTNVAEIDMSISGEKMLVVSYSDGASIFTDEIALSVMPENIIAGGVYKENGNDITWTIDKDGKLIVEGKGDFKDASGYNWYAPWYDNRESVKTAEVNVTGMTDASNMFYDCTNLTSLDVSGFDTSNMTSMGGMFSGCSRLTSLDVSGFDTSSVTDMGSMFSGCSRLTSLDVSDFDTSNVTNMEYMFSDCSRLTSLDVSDFDTSNVAYMSYMFSGCNSLMSLDLGVLDTSNVADMSGMFSSCSRLTSLGVESFDTSNVTSMEYMFFGCSSLMSLNVSDFDTSSITDMISMFSDCSGLTSLDVSGFDTSNVTVMNSMFSGCRNLTSLDVSSFNTSSVTEMASMFHKCSSLTSLDVSSFDTSNVGNMDYMFSGCSSITSLDLSGFDVGKNRLLDGIFDKCKSLAAINTPLNLTRTITLPGEQTDIWYQVDGTKITELPRNLNYSIVIRKNEIPVITSAITAVKTKTNYACGDVLNIDDLEVTYYDADGVGTKVIEDYSTNADEIDMSTLGTKILKVTYNDLTATVRLSVKELISGSVGDITWSIDEEGKLTVEGTGDFKGASGYNWYAPWYDNSESVKTAEVNVTGMTDASYMFSYCKSLMSVDLSGFDTSSVTDMSHMFSGCFSLTKVDLSGFDTSSVTSMNGMFEGCMDLISLDVGGFDTSNVTDMARMFSGCSSLTSLDVSSFDTSSITNMAYMFFGCSGLTGLDVSKFNTSNVESMRGMFCGCRSLTSLNVSGFDTSNVTNMDGMFYGSSGLASLDVSRFDTSNVTGIGYMFSGCSGLTSLDVRGFDTSKVTNMYGMFSGCSRLTSLDVSNFNTSNVSDMAYMFTGCRSLTSLDVSKFDTSNVGDMRHMFDSCISLTSLDVSGFNTRNVYDMESMFSHCDNLTELDLGGFDTSNVENMSAMFFNCYNLRSLDVSRFDTSKVYTMKDMFRGCSSLTRLDVSGFNTSNVYDMQYMFFCCKGLTNLDVSNFDTSSLINMYKMFRACENLTSLDLSSFNMNHVENVEDIISGCTSLTAIHTPYNLTLQVPLPVSEESTNTWHDEDGTEYAELPRNISYSILLTRNKATVPDIIPDPVPEKRVLSAENVTITLSDTYNYVYDGEAKTPEVTVSYIVSGNTVSGNNISRNITSRNITSRNIISGNLISRSLIGRNAVSRNTVSGNTISGNTTGGNTSGGHSITLEQGTDYTVTYENNINAFEAGTNLETEQAAPRVIITGQNEYSGTVSKVFSIQKAVAPEAEEQVVYIKDCSTPHEGCTLDLSSCFADYNDKTGYTVGNPVEDDTISGNVLSGEVSIDDKGVLTYAVNAGKSEDFVVIPVIVSFSNHNDAVINVKIVLEKENEDIQIENVSLPTARPESGRQLAAGSEVVLACETKGAEIYYTINSNGKELTNPDESSIKYTSPIIINSEVYIRAVAVKGMGRSKFINLHYTVVDSEDKVLKPYAVPGQGTVEKGTKVEFKCDTPDAVIYYTMGGNADMLGTVPIDDAHKYTGPIEINKDMAIKAVAKKDGLKDSDVSVFVYRINTTLDAPLAEPASGSVDYGSYISLKTDTGVNIYYTMDQTDPVSSASAKLYESRIRVDGKSGDVIVIRAAAEKKGVYSETVTFTYMVSENRVRGLQVMIAGSDEYIYTGSAITPAVIVTNNGEELVEGEDYTVRYGNNVKAADKNASKAPKVTITGKGNLTKSTSITFTIKPKDIGDEEEVVGGNIVVVKGKSAAPILFYDGVKLTAKDFDNPNAKKKYENDETITITGKGNFTGTRDIDVRAVDKNDMKKFTVVIDNKALKREPLIYDGEEKTLDGYFEVYDTLDKSTPLDEYSDYAVIYPKNNINAGKVKFTVVGLGEYYGTVTKAYTIKPRVIKTRDDGDMDVNVYDGDEYPFTGKSVTIPDIEVTCDGEILTMGKDYKVTYSNNKKVCTGNKAKCKISFIGNYKGSKALVRKFNITAAVMDDVDKINESVSVAVADMVYTGKPGAYKSIPYVTVNGVLLKSSDYKVSYYKDVDREQAIDGKTASSSVDLSNSDKQTVYMKIEGKGNYEGTLTAEYNVYKLAAGAIDLSKAKVTIVGGNKVEYTGEGVTPDIEVKYKSDSGWKTIDADDIGTYITVTYINNVNKGKATVMVNGNGEQYLGSKTATFSVVSKSMK